MDFTALIIAILIAQAVDFIGHNFVVRAVKTWYKNIKKPSWHPPKGVFVFAWITLYTLMGTASYLVWEERGDAIVAIALVFYGLQLFVNMLWPILFFGFKKFTCAFVDIVVLFALIVVTMILFWQINVLAGALLVPYALWIAFAARLNYVINKMNVEV